MRTEMHSHTFDTHEHIKELVKAGLKEPQAEAIIKTLVKSRDYDFSKLATKEQIAVLERAIAMIQQDMEKLATKEQLAHLEEKLSSKIDAVEEKFNNKIDAVEEKLTNKIDAAKSSIQSTILIWMIPFFLTIIGMIATLMLKIIGH